jgi:hypothetical protein
MAGAVNREHPVMVWADPTTIAHLERLTEYAAELAALIFMEYADDDRLLTAAKDIRALLSEAHDETTEDHGG